MKRRPPAGGAPPKQYEPFFSATHEYEDEAEIVEHGVTPTIRYDSLDRVVRTEFPDGTFSKVEFDSWHQEDWDQNDTVLESDWYEQRSSPGATDPEPSNAQERAAWLAAQHADSPTVVHLDTLGRPFLSVAHNVTGTGASRVHEFYRTRTELDIEGNTLAIFDARQHSTSETNHALNPSDVYATIEQRFDVLGRRLRIDSPDAGSRLTVEDVAGKPLRQWDSRGQTMRWQYDELQRQTHQQVAQGSTEVLVSRTVYGEALDPGGPSDDPNTPSTAQEHNLRGQAHLVFDGSGLMKSQDFDFKGNLLHAIRRLATTYQTTPSWNAIVNLTAPGAIEQEADSQSLLETEVFRTENEYDALNRITKTTLPNSGNPEQANVTRPVYNEANLLEELHVSVRGATEQTVIENIDYNARGQRILCEHTDPNTGNVTHRIEYEYDPETFRLVELKTTRTSDNALLQHLRYTFDPVGNITEMRDDANWDSVLNSLSVDGHGVYRYDALYRLVFATGREHPGQQPGDSEPPRWDIPHGNDLQALEAYREEIDYDEVGNILEMRHLRGTSNNASWRRRYKYAEDSNRLEATSLPGDDENEYSAEYEYNDAGIHNGGAHGSMTRMPHLEELRWDFADRLQHTIKSNGSGQHTYFTYDAGGQRVRKVYEHNNIVEERIYLGDVEIYRRRANTITGTLELERETLHVMDDERRVAMVETKLVDTENEDPAPLNAPRWRFQLDNHLGSSALELDRQANVISYEEYHPYGSTAFHTADGGAEVSRKRYRYTGKEKDEETGLYYHGARYYAAWLGRWTTADPLGLVDGLNLYRYSRNNPVLYSDPGGTESQKKGFFSSFADTVKDTAVSFGRGIKATGEGFGDFAYGVMHDDPEATIRGGEKVIEVLEGFTLEGQAKGVLAVGEAAVGVGTHAVEAVGAAVEGDTEKAGEHTAKALGNLAVVGMAVAGARGLKGGPAPKAPGPTAPKPAPRKAASSPKPFEPVPAGKAQLKQAGPKGKTYEPSKAPEAKPAAAPAEAKAPSTPTETAAIAQPEPVVSKSRVGTTDVGETVGELRAAGKKDAHHIIQDAAVRDLPGYNTQSAPGVQLPGPASRRGTPHGEATQVQRQPGGGTYAAERRIGYKALRKAGVPAPEARAHIQRADAYFESLGVSPDTVLRRPGNRPWR